MGNSCEKRMSSTSAASTLSPQQLLPWKRLDENDSLSRNSRQPSPRIFVVSPETKNSLLLVSHIFIDVFSFFEPIYRHYLLTLPLCRTYRNETSKDPRVWKAFLFAEPLQIDSQSTYGESRQELQGMHLELSKNMFRLKEAEVDIIADLMRKSRCCSTIQFQAMERLNGLLEDEHCRSKAQMGSIPAAIFETMNACMENEALLVKALYTTMLVLRPKGGSEGCLFKGDEMSSLHVPAVIDTGVKAVLNCMRKYTHSRRLQYMGCWAMVNMALEASHKVKLLEHGAINTVCAAMDAHKDEPKVQFRALFALINLVTLDGISQMDSPERTEELIARVVDVTWRYIKHLDIAGRGCMVLYNLSLDASNYEFLLRNNVIELLREASQLHPVDHMLTFVYSSTAARIAQSPTIEQARLAHHPRSLNLRPEPRPVGAA